MLLPLVLFGCPGPLHNSGKMRIPDPRVFERRRLCRILLGLNHQPTVVTGGGERCQHSGEADTAVARDGENAIEDRVEEASVARLYTAEHVGPHILAMHMADAAGVAARDGGRVGVGESQMPGIEQQPHILAGRFHQPLDLTRGLDHGSHVMVVGEPNAAPRQFVGQVCHPVPEMPPFTVAQPRPAR